MPLSPSRFRTALSPALAGRFTRRDVAMSPHIWLTLIATFSLLSASLFVVASVTAEFPRGRVLALATGLGVISVILARIRQPEPGSRIVHAVLALVYVAPAVAVCTFAPQGSAVVGTAVFVGPLVSVWLEDRRQIALHLAAATIVMFIPSALGIVDTGTLVACVTLAPASLVLAICCVVVMEAAEGQGDALALLAERDPLTGVGNRRLLDTTLEQELARHTARHEPLAILALDLNGFKALNDTVGHAAGDDLLRRVAGALVANTTARDTVVRQGGDEFCIVLPRHDQAAAERVVVQLRRQLAGIEAFGAAVSSGFGLAVFPRDGHDAESLLGAADARLGADKDDRRRRGPSPTAEAEGRGPMAHQREAPFVGTGPAELDGGLSRAQAAHRAATSGVTRAELAVNPLIWRLHGAMYVLYGLIGVGVLLWAPQLTTSAFAYVVAFGTLVGVAHLVSASPPITSHRNHLVIAMTYVVPALCLVTCQPGGSIAIGSAIFIGPLAATRLSNRWHLAAHMVVAALMVLALVPSGAVNAATTLAILILIVTFSVLAFVVAVVLEAVESQSDQLAAMAVRDPLTGVANRRGLDGFLEQLRGGERAAEPVAAVALDLNGFKALNDRVGHSAGDALLQRVATVLSELVEPGSFLVRLGGDEFCFVVPGAAAPEAAGLVERARLALATIDCNGAPLTSGYGIASAPAATDVADLLDLADADLIANKERARGSLHTAAGLSAVSEG